MSSQFFTQDGYVFLELGEEIKLIGDFFEILKANGIEFDLKEVLGNNFETGKVIKLVPEKDLCKIYVSDDNLAVFLNIWPVFPPSLTVQDILEELSKLQVVIGIDHELITNTIEQGQPVIDLPLARGIAPLPGSPQIIVNHFSPAEKVDLKTDEEGNVDFKNLDNVINIKKGTVLATRIREYEPEPGMDVFGNIIEPPPPINVNFDVGKGVIVVGDEAFAYMDGYLEWDDRNRINVNNTMVVNGDVAYGTGNLNVDGNILIKGDVLPGFSVIASRNVDILGSAEDASIQAGGDVNICGSVVGKRGCDIEAGGDINVYYAQNSTLRSKGSITVKRYVYNSRLMTEDTIYINSREGVVLGDANEIVAKNAIYIRSILQDKPLEIAVTGYSGSEYAELLNAVEIDIVKKLEAIKELDIKKTELLNKKQDGNNELFELLKLEQSFKDDLTALNKSKKRLSYIIHRIPQPGVIEIERSSCLKLTIFIAERSITVSPFYGKIKFISDEEQQALVMQ